MDRIPILQMEEFLLVTIQVDMHDQLALTLQEELTTHIVQRARRADRYFGAGDRGFLYWLHAEHHGGDGAHARRRDGGGGDATGGGYYPGGVGPVAHWRADGPQCGKGHGISPHRAHAERRAP